MKIKFLGQGLHPESEKAIGSVIVDSLRDQTFHTFICIVAFASVDGISVLSQYLEKAKTYIKRIMICVGIDLHLTSKEALESLLRLGVDTRVFHTSSAISFHPKLYIFEGQNKYRVIIGSSNLTTPGLFQNVETVTQTDFDKSDINGMRYLNDINDYYEDILDGTNPNLITLNSEDVIERLAKLKLVISESEHARSRGEGPSDGNGKENEERIAAINALFPKRKVGKVLPHTKPTNTKEEMGGIHKPRKKKGVGQFPVDWQQYAQGLRNLTEEGSNLYWKIGQQNRSFEVHMEALNLIDNNPGLNENTFVEEIQKIIRARYPGKNMTAGFRSLFLSKVTGFVSSRQPLITTAPFSIVKSRTSVFLEVEKYKDILTSQLEKMYYWNSIYGTFSKYVPAIDRVSFKDFQIYPFFFIYQILLGLIDEYNYANEYLTETEFNSFLAVTQTHIRYKDVLGIIDNYRNSNEKKEITQLLEKSNAMDPRFINILHYNKHLIQTDSGIKLRESDIPEIRKKVKDFNSLSESGKLIHFNETNPENYHDMLYSAKSLLFYHESL